MKRKNLNFLIVVIILGILIVLYGAIAVANIWVCYRCQPACLACSLRLLTGDASTSAQVWYIVPNALSATAAFISLCLPLVLRVGYQGAHGRSMGKLQLFAFMMVLAVTLQLSVCLLILMDDGSLSAALGRGIVVGMKSVCTQLRIHSSLPFGLEGMVGMDNIQDVCDCIQDIVSATSGSGTLTEGTYRGHTPLPDVERRCLRQFLLATFACNVVVICVLIQSYQSSIWATLQ